MKAALVEAAERVRRLSRPGTPERFFTVIAVSDETGFRIDRIVATLCRLESRESEEDVGTTHRAAAPEEK
jgi:hypothetical protein